MKINEIIVREGPLDAIKTGVAAMLGNKQAQMARNVSKIADIGVKAWRKQVQNLEALNDFQPLSQQQIATHLMPWIDKSLMGNFTISQAPADLKADLELAKREIGVNPTDNNVLKKHFVNILSKAQKMQLDGVAQADSKDTSTGTTVSGCNNQPTTYNAANQTIYVCGKAVTPQDKGYDDLKQKLGID